MTVVINGTTGVTSVNGTAGAPSMTGTDTDTGIVYGTNTMSLATGGTTAVTIDSSQNVGIGTSSPSAPLHVNSSTTSAITKLQNSNTTNTQTLANSDFYFDLSQGGSIVWRNKASTAESMRIDSSGLMGLGMLPAATVRLAVASSSSFIFVGRDSTGTTDQIRIASNGNVQNTNNSYGALSDLRLKENITDATPKLAQLNQVRVVNYNLKSDPEHKQLGVIAQELEQIFPSMIEETVDHDDDGNDLGTTTKGVKYSVFVPMLIKAIQELKAEFDEYKAAHP